jgi:hypothetical protein
MLDSPDEDEHVRDAAFRTLFHSGCLPESELTALANDPQKRVAERARRFLERLRAVREAGQEEPPPGK